MYFRNCHILISNVLILHLIIHFWKADRIRFFKNRPKRTCCSMSADYRNRTCTKSDQRADVHQFRKASFTKTSILYRRTLRKYPARYLSLSHLMAYYFILIPGTVIRTFLIVAAHKTIVLVFIQINIAVIFVAFFIVSIICAEFTASSLHCLPLLFDSFFVITVLNYTTI